MRKNKGLVTELRETIDKQQIALSDQAQRIAQLEQRLGKVQGHLSRIEELDGLSITRVSIRYPGPRGLGDP